MVNIFNRMISSVPLMIAGAYWGVIITVILVILFFIKSSRDERGRAIIGKASIISALVFIVLVNVVCKLLDSIEISYVTMGNCFQWIYNIVLTVETVVILIYKKIE